MKNVLGPLKLTCAAYFLNFQGGEISEIDEAEMENLKSELERTLGRDVVEKSLSKPSSVKSNISAIMREEPGLTLGPTFVSKFPKIY